VFRRVVSVCWGLGDVGSSGRVGTNDWDGILVDVDVLESQGYGAVATEALTQHRIPCLMISRMEAREVMYDKICIVVTKSH